MSAPSRAELVARLTDFRDRDELAGFGKPQAVTIRYADLCVVISALTAPLSADREAVARVINPRAWAKVDRLNGTHNWQDWPKMKAKWCSPSLAKADAILALTAPRGAGEGIEDIGLSSETRPQPSSKSELQEPCDLEVSVNPQGDTSDEYQWPLPNDVPTYEDALRLVLHFQKPSTSFVQLKLQLGYNRAASFIERMEAEGVCTRSNYAGKREMLHPPATSDLSDRAMKREDRTAHNDPKPVLPANAKGMKP